jgi:hypothetical protein
LKFPVKTAISAQVNSIAIIADSYDEVDDDKDTHKVIHNKMVPLSILIVRYTSCRELEDEPGDEP